MAESSESFTSEQESVLIGVEETVLSAIKAQCAGCSTANFAPKRLGRAVANGRLSEEIAKGIASRFENCSGFQEVPFGQPSTDEAVVLMCHYPQHQSN